MHVTVDAQHLANTAAWVDRFAPNRPTVPVLAAQLLTATADGTLTLAATDYDTTAHANIDAGVHQPGQVAVSSRVLAAVTARLGTGAATLALDGGRLAIRCGNTEFVLTTLPAEDYPLLPEPPEPVGQVDGAELAAAAVQAAAVTSRQKGEEDYANVQLHLGGDLVVSGTDRYRIVSRTLTWDTDHHVDPTRVLIHRDTLLAATRGMTGPLRLAATDTLFALADDTRTVTTTLAAANLPDLPGFLNRRFAQETPTTVTVDTAGLINAIERAAVVTPNLAEITLDIGEGGISVTGGRDDTGSDAITADTDGPDIEAMYYPDWLLAILKSLGADTVRLRLPDPYKPTLITAIDTDGQDIGGYRALINPRRHVARQAAA